MPLVPVRCALDTIGRTTLAEPSQIVASLFVSEATRGAQYFIQIGNARPAGPFSGGGLTILLGRDVPLTERSEGVYLVNESAVPNGVVVVQVGYATK